MKQAFLKSGSSPVLDQHLENMMFFTGHGYRQAFKKIYY